MTLPTNINLPLHSDKIKSEDPEDLEGYMRDLIYELTRMYERIAQAVNGNIKGDFGITEASWMPTIKGITEGAAPSVTYTHQIGYVLRQGISTDVWFDIEWSSVTDYSGDLYLELPYQVAKVTTSATMPFVGIVQPSSITYTGGTEMVINGIPNTFRGELWNTGSAFATANQAIVNSGRLLGHLRYLGNQNER